LVFRDELKDFWQDTNRDSGEMAEKYRDISEELKEFRNAVKSYLEAFGRPEKNSQSNRSL